jgi:uncharacterized protein (UPF0216 family)
MGIEAARLRQGLVEDRKRLSVLLAEEEPQAVTKGGEPYLFDKAVIALFGENVPPQSGSADIPGPVLLKCKEDSNIGIQITEYLLSLRGSQFL